MSATARTRQEPDRPPQLQICGYVPGSTCVLNVYFLDCFHHYNVLDTDLDGLVARGCVQCHVTSRRVRGKRVKGGPGRADQGSDEARHLDTGGRVYRQAVKLVFDCR